MRLRIILNLRTKISKHCNIFCYKSVFRNFLQEESKEIQQIQSKSSEWKKIMKTYVASVLANIISDLN
ncbi:hypothetical protein BpHYR1_044690 [Brachionus plicatilis]|uniref:Uncharacterized protein n=1 Tax=Brachionus plicatilis TaxID=10195 RepID=A0A3M7PJ33_BRAPC|nr:hypothetical protein BpHYR1_044690 [Brachionus plicatilis]